MPTGNGTHGGHGTDTGERAIGPRRLVLPGYEGGQFAPVERSIGRRRDAQWIKISVGGRRAAALQQTSCLEKAVVNVADDDRLSGRRTSLAILRLDASPGALFTASDSHVVRRVLRLA